MGERWPLMAGAVVGLGIILIIAGIVPRHPDLRAALTRMTRMPTARQDAPVRAVSSAMARRSAALRTRYLPALIEQMGLNRYSMDLSVTHRSVEDLAVRKLAYAAGGAALPVLIATFAALFGLPLPFGLPLVVGVILGVLGFFLPDLDLREKAKSGRDEIRVATSVYLELVALERAADAGTTEALERAATVGNSWVFLRIQNALLQAELGGHPPWHGLAELGKETGVPELADLADIAELAGNDGAAVYASLSARATSMRTQMISTATAEANADSERMVIPVSLLGITFMVLVGYPAFIRIFTT